MSDSAEMNECKLSRRMIHEGRILDLYEDTVELTNGHTTLREVVRHPGGACIAPLFPDGRIALVRQYRYPFAQPLLEVPAGKLSSGEAPLDCAVRELREETGLAAARIEGLGCIYPSPAFLSEIIHLFVATGLTQHEQALDDDELLRVEHLPLADALALIDDGSIRDAKTVALLLKLERLMRSGRFTL